MFRPTPYSQPSQLIVVIGNATVQLGVLAQTPLGRESLQDLFSTPRDQTQNYESLSLLDIQHALRIWGVEPFASDLYTVSLTQLNGVRCVCWKTGINEFYREERLIETKAGRALLETPATANRRARVSQCYPASDAEARRDGELSGSSEPLHPTAELPTPPLAASRECDEVPTAVKAHNALRGSFSVEYLRRTKTRQPDIQPPIAVLEPATDVPHDAATTNKILREDNVFHASGKATLLTPALHARQSSTVHSKYPLGNAQDGEARENPRRPNWVHRLFSHCL